MALNEKFEKWHEGVRIKLINARNEQIAPKLAELGLNETKLIVGDQYLARMDEAVSSQKTESAEKELAYDLFESLLDQLVTKYRRHRSRAKFAYRNNTEALKLMHLNTTVPVDYSSLITEISDFYAYTTASEENQAALIALNISAEELTQGKTEVESVKTARATYMKERGESENATTYKESAKTNLLLWERDFDTLAKFALEDEPQLLETLGIKVKS